MQQAKTRINQKAKSRLKTSKLSTVTKAVITLSVIVAGLWGLVFYMLLNPQNAQNSLITPVITHTVIKQPELENGVNMWTGEASYYSRKGCLGCSESLTMANGQPLDDSKLTVAFNKLPLGKMVRIINNATNDVVTAEITDTGGFERPGLNRIIDLSLATKNAINCSDLCDVTILYK